MRTYLKDWMTVKQSGNLAQINVFSTWDLTKQNINLKKITDDNVNHQVIIEYDIVNDPDFTGLKTVTARTVLQTLFPDLPDGHEIVLRAYENAELTDDESSDTGSAPEN
jgi:hypothetical protein